MAKYLLRLDDASEYMDTKKWTRITVLLDKYDIKPIFGIIPHNQDESIIKKFQCNPLFWEWVHQRLANGWIPAMHGYEHRYVTTEGGMNPVNKKSEFAGLSFEEQSQKIAAGYTILKEHGIMPVIFFAPAHTFDETTLDALREMTQIRVISDTIAYDVYKKDDFWFIPQQSGQVRSLPFQVTTFCYHPNTMKEKDVDYLERFLMRKKAQFISYTSGLLTNRGLNAIDYSLRWLYFWRRK